MSTSERVWTRFLHALGLRSRREKRADHLAQSRRVQEIKERARGAAHAIHQARARLSERPSMVCVKL